MKVLLLAVLVVLLSGCGLWRKGGVCKDPTGYQGSAEIPPLRVPDGVEPMNGRNVLKIPEPKGTKTRRDDGRCLDEPPPFVVEKPAAT